jgi:molybdopterin-guanine dinucleotide biosynthesis protein A
MNDKYDDIAGLILVGGKSSRMGRDKAFLDVNGHPLFERALSLFRRNFAEILLSGDRAERFATYGFPVLGDIHPGSPLGGIYTGLVHAKTPYLFVASCDLPFPSEAVLRHLCSIRDGFDIVVPITDQGYEPLFALYSRRCLKTIEEFLASGECCAYGYYDKLSVREVTGGELAELDKTGNCFRNINTPEEFDHLGEELRHDS